MLSPMLTSDNPSLSEVRVLAIASKKAHGDNAYSCRVVYSYALFVSYAKYLIWSLLSGSLA